MKRIVFVFLLFPLISIAQKKPLDHSVYDSWQSVGERMISNDGKWIVFTVNPQEGDGELFIESVRGNFKLNVPRGYNARITEDNRFVVFRIKPPFKDTRQAKIKKKKADEMPRDSLGIVELGKDAVAKFDRVKSYKTPEKGFGWVAIEQEPVKEKAKPAKNKAVDSLKKTIDSLKIVINELKNIPAEPIDVQAVSDTTEESKGTPKGSDLVLYNLLASQEIVFNQVGGFDFDKPGKHLVFFANNLTQDPVNNNGVILYSLDKKRADTILSGINDARSLAFSDDGARLAFVAESGTDKKALQKFYDLYLFRQGSSIADKIVDRFTQGIPENYSVSNSGNVRFSENGSKLFFGTAPIHPAKDTTLVEMDLVKVDIWHYKDDYLQTQQLSRLSAERRRSYLAMYDPATKKVQQLANEGLPAVMLVNEGNADFVIATTDTGRRVSAQWEGKTLEDVYTLQLNTGKLQLVKKNLDGRSFASPMGRYVIWYDNRTKNYYSFDGKTEVNISKDVSTQLYDELHDSPSDPRPYGTMGWQKDDAFFYVYDRYDVWKLDPTGRAKPINITGNGRALNRVYRYVKTDADERFLVANQQMLFDVFNEEDKSAALVETRLSDQLRFKTISSGDVAYSRPMKAKNANTFFYTKESYVQSPDLYAYDGKEKRITAINPQQADYNWGTSELFHWAAFDGKPASGILYKPEDFDSTKKYPVILYFYERVTETLNRYIAPSPTPSRLNISFFVSRGYVVLAPDIAYFDGHPGRSAYNYIVSGAEALAKKPWIDGDNMGIQGQSWGGYQVSHLITRTDMFKAAWAGAPVVNMFSAYGGIRWQTGMNRQFQYEKTQSRIGATIWERPELYIENSPLFHFQNVNTPVVIMANDEDGAVPWYQGIEMFTALRRLGKPVWMLNYNGEAHNLVERKNRKDIQIREQQFFDWLLKGEAPAKWITEGVKAVDKGITWGLETEEGNN